MRATARLIVTAGGEGIHFLRPGRYIFGRLPDCILILDNPEVSRRHAVIDVGDTTATVADQGSRHGRRVGGKKVDTAPLQHATAVEFGPVGCRFEWMAAVALDYPTPSWDREPTSPVLSPAEHRVLLQLLGGLSEKAIAARLTVSQHTVHNHVRRIYAAHGVNTRSELLAQFISRPEPLVPPLTQESPPK